MMNEEVVMKEARDDDEAASALIRGAAARSYSAATARGRVVVSFSTSR
ncbi:hypothetical protein RPYSC3_17200 [Rhodopseudomonas palustris]|nr:hypothetical protein RPYSC3_17200 [Rhodopseudomonas palustris]